MSKLWFLTSKNFTLFSKGAFTHRKLNDHTINSIFYRSAILIKIKDLVPRLHWPHVKCSVPHVAHNHYMGSHSHSDIFIYAQNSMEQLYSKVQLYFPLKIYMFALTGLIRG